MSIYFFLLWKDSPLLGKAEKAANVRAAKEFVWEGKNKNETVACMATLDTECVSCERKFMHAGSGILCS